MQKNTHIILIAEDEEINYFLIEMYLKRMRNFNFEIIHAINGQEAIDIAKDNEFIDLILMDIKMLVLDGLQATASIKAFRPHLPIVAQTAYSTETERQKALDVGCIEVLSKPIDEYKLAQALQNYLNVDSNAPNTV